MIQGHSTRASSGLPQPQKKITFSKPGAPGLLPKPGENSANKTIRAVESQIQNTTRRLADFKVASGTVYSIIGTYDTVNNVKSAIWKRRSNTGLEELGTEAVLVTEDQFEELWQMRDSNVPQKILEKARSQGYNGLGGRVLYIFDGRLEYSSSLLEPNFYLQIPQEEDFLIRFLSYKK